MNDINSLLGQQTGFSKWNQIDNVLKRLECRRNEQFWQIDHTSQPVSDPPVFACKFAQKEGYEHVFAIANEIGQIAVHNTMHTSPSLCGFVHNNAIFDITWMFGRMKLISASGDHTAALIDIRESSMELEGVFQGHSQTIKTVACHPDGNPIFATGGRDGKILVWDARHKNQNLRTFPDAILHNTHILPNTQKKTRCISGVNSVTSLVFQDEHSLISCGAGDGIIKIWDTRKTYSQAKRKPTPKFQIPYPGTKLRKGFSNLILSPDRLKLFASCLDNVIYCFNVGTYKIDPIMKYSGHKNSTFYVKSCLSKDGKYLISGSSDMSAYIWNVENSYPLVLLGGHEAEVTCVAWKPQGDPVIVTCSDDLRHNIWRIGTEEVHEDVVGKAKILHQPQKPKVKRYLNSEMLISSTKRLKINHEPLQPIENIQEDEVLATVLEDFEISPKRMKLSHETQENTLVSDLPNFVVDGVAPHLNISPVKKPDIDWLTRLRKDRQIHRNDLEDISRPSPPKSPRLYASPGKNRTPRKNKESQSPLLKFFKVTNSNCSCSPKTSGVATPCAQPQHSS